MHKCIGDLLEYCDGHCNEAERTKGILVWNFRTSLKYIYIYSVRNLK